MKRLLFIILLLMAVMMATNASAQSSAYKPYSWTGFYLGFQGSYNIGNSKWETNYSNDRVDQKVEGGMGGFFMGYNFQTDSKMVIGFEWETNYGRVEGSSSCPNSSYACKTDIYWIGALKGRFGYAFDRFLPYVTVGWAYANADTHVKYLPTGREYGSTSGYYGFTPGIGLEFAVTKNFLLRAEYSYYYFFRSSTDTYYYDTTDVWIDNSAFKAGLSFKF